MYASTAYVYSDQGSFYRVSKQSAESVIEEYSKEFGISYTFFDMDHYMGLDHKHGME